MVKQVYVTMNEAKIRQIIAEKIAAMYDGNAVQFSSDGIGSQWSDWIAVYNDDGTFSHSERVPGTWYRVTGVSGTIHATANNGEVEIHIDYQIQVANVG